MTDYEMLSIGIFFGGLMAMFFVGIGVIIGDVRHNFDVKRKLDVDPDGDVCICGRNGSGSSYNRCTEQDIREHARKLGIKLEEGAKKRA